MTSACAALLLAASLAAGELRALPAFEAAAPGDGGAAFAVLSIAAPELTSLTRPARPETVGLYLPEHLGRCRDGSRACWLVIYLPGFDYSVQEFQAALLPVIEKLEGEGAPPLVVVVPDGRTNLGGGFYLNSTQGGRWEDLLMKELIPAAQHVSGIPARRTVILGHSMGGFGAIRLALLHGEAFSGAGALNPLVRPRAMTELLLPMVERALHSAQPDPMELVSHPTEERFTERLLWAQTAAFDPADRFIPIKDSTRHPWQAKASALAAFKRFDLVELAGRRAKTVAGLERIFVAGGTRDPLIPARDVVLLGAGLSKGCTDPAHRQVILGGGDHTSSLATDLASALKFLTQPPAPCTRVPAR